MREEIPMHAAPGFRPLYRQVYDYLVRQIVEGRWAPAQMLPSEQNLAGELGVSQGTVRKALDAMTAERLVERRQGKGTYVAAMTEDTALFRFFRLRRQDGRRVAPTSAKEVVRTRLADGDDQARLKLSCESEVVEIQRTRLVDGAPVVWETIILPAHLFPGVARTTPLPNALYELYQRDFGHNIVAVEEELRADIARRGDARRLGLDLGTPLLHIERTALSLDGLRVERRISRCDTRALVYAVTLR